MSAYPWLAEMPAAECPETCVVRLGETLGVVTYNAAGWRVVYLGQPYGHELGGEMAGFPTPESAGWRHALDHRSGFAYVWQAVEAHMAHSMNPEHTRILRAVGMKYGEWLPIRHRWIAQETTDADRLMAARMFAAVLR